MNRKILAVSILVIMSMLMVACNQGEKAAQIAERNTQNMDIKFDENGVEFDVPEKWLTSDISDSLGRYKSLKKIGVTDKLINKAILQQN